MSDSLISADTKASLRHKKPILGR